MAMIGKKAPVFRAPAVINGTEIVQDFSLAQYLGKKEVIFFFYPKDFTFVCPTELIAFQNALGEFEQKGVAIVGCSTDTEETHIAWLNTPRNQGGIMGVTYPIVADIAKTISANYGVLGGEWEYDEEGGFSFSGLPVAYRGTFFIDKQGIIRHESINELSLGRNIAELLRIADMWHHVEQFGEVCPVNWTQGQESMQATREGVSSYLTKNMDNK
ncbi:alkyl hydroperoxide reductase/ Thiol specific antioxidant/ Mal allergen [Candidatus Amoebophilus asiaticus 5a2]|uniref:Thioredoxin peroxidase n=1 Tax=Amoebophilus asiaticus (strain 5a2) TaxID=452471 RepID=B3EUA1_AMOA5|nr:peroxiredoxin [Candidatus Amoebophilus asiaticus]ACE05520.1 alkyl hydroperoxide reductase/ Thiol specific antioxidant/ Mal allergen [Candidatus Amoebophilus asiaticus 5a2]